ncbi:MAG: TonB-dependent receptor plug [Gemmatimonadetes bacterium]|nr:TonB-dependent receptor plug [Gemmatimonadota bacterium]
MAPRLRAAYRCGYVMRNLSSLRGAVLSLALTSGISYRAQAQNACADHALVGAPAAGWTPPLDTRVSLHVRDVSLRDALDRLTAASRVQLAYSADFLPVDRRVCLAAEGEPLGSLLASLLRGTQVQVLVVAGRVVLSPGATQAAAEPASRSVSVLERVVVTGNAVAAPRRPLVIGVEVIDGENLRRQSFGSLAEMLNASVPGVWSWSQAPSSLVAQYGSIRGASSFGSSAPKIYIDGVEVANPLLVTQFNPDVVDHVEVIRGPQGSALYGSDAISGVINVMTRHDGGGYPSPAVSVRSTAGAAGSAFVSGLVPTHEQRLNLRAGTNVRSAGLAVAFGQTGALFPSSDTRQLAATGDARLVTSRETLTMSARLFDKRSGIGPNPILSGIIPVAPATGMSGPGGGSTMPVASSTDPSQSVRQYTLSSSAAFVTEGAWTHSLLAGVDGYSLNNVADAIGPLTSAVDSALRAARGNGDRFTLRESSVAHFGSDDAPGTVTLGVEHSVLRQASTYTTRTPGTDGQQFPTATDVLRESWNHNTGLISQLNMSWRDAIFVSGGLRLERNDAFSGNDRYPLLPMAGVAVVRSVGAAEVKWRAAYGKGIRPPQTPARGAASGYANNLGFNGSGTVGSVVPALDPEVQAGYEGGVELYFGRALSLQVTRFDQDVTGLIQNVAVAVDTFAGRGGSIERRMRYQLQNVGEITNTGWEFQGNLAQGPFALNGSYSSVDSRVRTLANGYLGDLRPGDRMLAVPARTGALTFSFTGDRWFASLGATRAMDWINYDRLSLATSFAQSNGYSMKDKDVTGSNLRSFWKAYDGDTHLRLTGSRDLSRGVALLLTGENLLGGQLGEPDNVTIRPGRTVTAGLRASF